MRLPFPEKISLVAVFYFAVSLCAIQQLQGTNAVFSILSLCYILAAATAFNLAGGFTRTTGSFVFFNSVLGVILGLCVKAYLDEPADSNLQAPNLTMLVYLAGMCMMLVAVLLSKKVATKRALLRDLVVDSNIQTATVGCLITGLCIYAAGRVFPYGNGSVLSALSQINRFLPLTIFLGVLNTIRRSKGTRSINIPVLLAVSFMFFDGAINYSKETMFTPFACWFVAASSQRYRLSRPQLVGVAGCIFVIFYYLVPYSQYGRTFKENGYNVDIQTSISLMANLGDVRKNYLETSNAAYDERIYGYFNHPQGFFDRLEMIGIDDALINHTRLFGTLGPATIVESFENVVPHFIWPDKPHILTGNLYAHEVGILGEEDEGTGVSFTSGIVSYHLLGWWGIFLFAPFLWFILFTVFDSLCGDTRTSPWGLIVMLLYIHGAPEGDVSAVIYMFTIAAFAVVFAAIIGSYLMPVIGTFFIGPEGITLRRAPRIQSVRNSVILPESSQG